MKTVVVCGGSKGIGAASIKNLISRGFSVVCVSRSKGTLQSDVLESKQFRLITCDLSSEVERENLISELLKIEYIWGIVNNASGPFTGLFENASKEEYLKAFETHLFASDAIVKAVLPQFKNNRGGRIVNIISVTAKIPLESMSVSNTLRGAMLNWSKTLSKELGKYGITVNNVLPGYTETERLIEVIEGVSSKLGVEKSVYSDKIIGQIPMNRFGRPEEIGAVVGFLISDDASFINGASIPVDGGWTPCP